MKKALFVLCLGAILAMMGCNKGGTGNQYDTGQGSTNSPGTGMHTNTDSQQ
jgi:hypothetical protein